jgi:hypothetical protein
MKNYFRGSSMKKRLGNTDVDRHYLSKPDFTFSLFHKFLLNHRASLLDSTQLLCLPSYLPLIYLYRGSFSLPQAFSPKMATAVLPKHWNIFNTQCS